MAKSKPSGEKLDVPVDFGGVSIGDEYARLGILFDRSDMTTAKADHFLCGARCEVKIAVDPAAKKDAPDQSKFSFADARVKLESVADIKRYGVGPKSIGAGLTFKINNMDDVARIARFAKKKGRIVLKVIGESGDNGDVPPEGEEVGEAADDKT